MKDTRTSPELHDALLKALTHPDYNGLVITEEIIKNIESLATKTYITGQCARKLHYDDPWRWSYTEFIIKYGR